MLKDKAPAPFSSTYTEIGMIKIIMDLCKDDTQIHEAFHIFGI